MICCSFEQPKSRGRDSYTAKVDDGSRLPPYFCLLSQSPYLIGIVYQEIVQHNTVTKHVLATRYTYRDFILYKQCPRNVIGIIKLCMDIRALNLNYIRVGRALLYRYLSSGSVYLRYFPFVSLTVYLRSNDLSRYNPNLFFKCIVCSEKFDYTHFV